MGMSALCIAAGCLSIAFNLAMSLLTMAFGLIFLLWILFTLFRRASSALERRPVHRR